MKPINMLGLAVLTALTALAFVGASSAMAENTQLCNKDPLNGACSAPVTAVHEVSLGKGKILSSSFNVECDVLFSSTSVGALGAPQVIKGHFTYSNCNGNCTVTEVSTIWIRKILKKGHEIAEDTQTGEVHVHCPGFLDCDYDAQNLIGTVKGPLLASDENGETAISGQELHKVSGLFCPLAGYLDLTLAGLLPEYIGT